MMFFADESWCSRTVGMMYDIAIKVVILIKMICRSSNHKAKHIASLSLC